MGLINELGGQPYSCIHTSFTAIYNVYLDGGSTGLLHSKTGQGGVGRVQAWDKALVVVGEEWCP